MKKKFFAILNTIIKYILVTTAVFISIILLLVVFLECRWHFWSDIDFEEENKMNLYVSEEPNISEHGPRYYTSFVITSPEDMRHYLDQREYGGRPSFYGNFETDSLDFENYDYIFSEGVPIQRIRTLIWDQCSFYESDTLTPILYDWKEEQVSRKVYIYKIKPKHKYRGVCG
jgi:hypothetical protein